jgi:hypothetical protein
MSAESRSFGVGFFVDGGLRMSAAEFKICLDAGHGMGNNASGVYDSGAGASGAGEYCECARDVCGG